MWLNLTCRVCSISRPVLFKLSHPSQQFNLISACRPFASQVSGSDEQKKPSLYQRFKLMYKEYWYVLVPVHLVTSAVWFSGFYYLAVTGVDIAKLLELMSAPDSWVSTMRESKAGGLVTAYTLYKVATPARYTVTLGGTTVSINYLKKWGWIKPMPSSDKIRSIYQDQKSKIQERIQVTTLEIKDEFKKTADDISNTVKEAKTELRHSVTDTKDEFKQSMREAGAEWKHIGKLVKQRTGELVHKTVHEVKK